MINKINQNMLAKSCTSFFFLALMVIISNNILAQSNSNSYRAYYELTNEAKLLSFNKDYKTALEKYEEAFSTNIGFEDDYTESIKAALKLNIPQKVYALLKEKLIKTGWYSDELFDSTFNIFLKTSFGKKYSKQKKEWESQNRMTIDASVYGFIRSIDATDQYIRGGFNKVIRTYVSDSVFKLFKPALIEYTDSFNFVRLKKFIVSNGFPGRSKLGGKDYMHTIILHQYNYNDKTDSLNASNREKFRYLDSVLLGQISIGEFSPWHYAYATDYSLSINKTSLYGVNQFYKFTIQDIENVEKRRKEIGLMSLKQQCVLSGKPLPSNYKE